MAVSTHISRCVRDNLADFVRAVLAAAAALLATGSAHADRRVVPLDGTWSVDESAGADETPASFGHTAAVPGLTNQAQPPFPDVEVFRLAAGPAGQRQPVQWPEKFTQEPSP